MGIIHDYIYLQSMKMSHDYLYLQSINFLSFEENESQFIFINVLKIIYNVS